MRAPATPAHCRVVRFLSALAGDARPGELLELRYRLDDGERMGQLFEPVGRLQGLATAAVALGRRTDVYVGCAPRSRRHGGRDSVQHAFVLWADCDGEDAVSALARFDPQPAIIIASGSIRSRLAWGRCASGVGRWRHVADLAGCCGRRGRGCVLARAEGGRS